MIDVKEAVARGREMARAYSGRDDFTDMILEETIYRGEAQLWIVTVSVPLSFQGHTTRYSIVTTLNSLAGAPVACRDRNPNSDRISG